METLTRAIVEKNRVANCIPNCRELHASRTAHGEVQSARFAMPFKKPFIEVKRSEHELLSVANHTLDEMTKLVERCQFQDASRRD